MRKLSHVGIAVKNIDEAITLFTDVLGFEPPKVREEYPEIGFKNALFFIGDNFIELLESTDPKSDIGRFLERRGFVSHLLGS